MATIEREHDRVRVLVAASQWVSPICRIAGVAEPVCRRLDGLVILHPRSQGRPGATAATSQAIINRVERPTGRPMLSATNCGGSVHQAVTSSRMDNPMWKMATPIVGVTTSRRVVQHRAFTFVGRMRFPL